MLREIGNHGSTPPASSRQGQKNDHSPWSAQRERKRRGAVQEAHLTSIEEAEYTTSPPKRHNGGTSPAARELPLRGAPLGSPFSADAALADAGPLAQGLFTSRASIDDAGFSPLAAGASLLAATGLSAPTLPADTQPPWANGDKQRKQVRHAAAFRLAASKHRGAGAAAAPRSSQAVNAAAAGPSSSAAVGAPAPAPFDSLLWHPTSGYSAGQPFSLPTSQQQLPLPAQQHPQPEQQRYAPVSHLPPHAPAAAHNTHQQQHLPRHGFDLGHHDHHPQQRPSAPASAARYQQQHLQPPHNDLAHPMSQQACSSVGHTSTGHDMETDLRSSWGSERSADVTGWQTMQARLRDETELMRASPVPFMDMRDEPAAAAARSGRRGSLLAAALAGDAMHASADGGASLYSSLEAPSCSDRQTSMLPLRATMKNSNFHSHLASPAAPDGSSPDPLLGRPSSSRPRSRGYQTKWSCFSCSPFTCKQRPGDDSDDEVIRRNTSEEDFVIRCQQSFPPPSTSRDERDSVGRLPRRATLNRPPSGDDDDLVNRQDAFSLRTGSTPGAAWSPCSEAGSFSLSSGPLRSVGLREGLEELAGGGSSSQGAPPTVDSLNDMLKTLSLCRVTHPKEAEQLVAQACQNNAIQPNATTARTLDKMWAVHEQLYG